MIKVKRFFHLPKWLKQKPKVTYIVCPRCQRQADDDTPYSQVKPLTEEYTPDQGRLMVAQQAMDAAADLDARRRHHAAGDLLKTGCCRRSRSASSRT